MNQSNYTYGLISQNIFQTFPLIKSTWETQKSKQPAYTLYKIKKTSENFALPKESTLKNFKRTLRSKKDFFEIIEFSESTFSKAKNDLFHGLKSLHKIFTSDDGEKISLESLKGLLVFLYAVQNFIKPNITLNDLGYFQLNWKKDRANLLTVSFKEKELLDYVIFMPSRYASKRIILNGSMNTLDFKDYLSKLEIKLHKDSQ